MKFTRGESFADSHLNNTTVDWYSSDSKKAFNKRLEETPDDENLLYYKKNPIKYELNNYGFRTPVDFTQGLTGNLFLGCSHTFGIGHYLKNVWSWKVNKAIGGNFLNLSVPGTGIATSTRLLYYFKDILKPKNIFLHSPHSNRFEMYNARGGWTTFNPASEFWNETGLSHYYRKLLMSEDNQKMHRMVHFNMIKTMAKDIGADLYCLPPIGMFSAVEPLPIPNKARDYHLPVVNHNVLAERYLMAYKEKTPPHEFRQDFQIKNIL